MGRVGYNRLGPSVHMTRKIILAAVFLWPLCALAQYTTVTAVVQDSNNDLYSNCTGSASFNGQNSTPGAGPYLLGGSTFQTVAALNCDSSGNLKVSLADNNQISPPPSQWAFSICSAAGLVGGPYCKTTLITITGATQDISSALTASLPILPQTGTINLSSPPKIGNVTPNTGTFTILNQVVHIGIGATDLGAQANAAYAALPANGGQIIIDPKSDNSCYAFTTPIVFATAGKYVLLSYGGPGGEPTGGSEVGCLNFTPSTGAAITLDYTDNAGNSISSAHGLSNIILSNNLCQTLAGCGGSAIGILIGSTNHGIQGATMNNVSVSGFSIGYKNTNFLSDPVTWINPQFWVNGIGWDMGNVSTTPVLGGEFDSNGTAIKADTASCVSSCFELRLFGTTFVANPNWVVDASGALGAGFECHGCHFENGSSAGAAAHYIQGGVTVALYGGLAEDDSSSGSSDYWFNAQSVFFNVYGTIFNTGTRNPSVGVIQSATTTRVAVQAYNANPATLTNIVGGGGAATLQIESGNTSNAAADWIYESRLQTPRLRLKGTALIAGDFTVNAGWGNGPATIGTITGSDAAWQGTITATGTGQTSNPTLLITFHDGTFTTAPVCNTKLQASNDAGATYIVTDTPVATGNTITYRGTATGGDTYTFSSICIGR